MKRLSLIRKEAKLRGSAVAREAKIDRSYYRYIELGKYIPSPDVATRIANALNKLTGKQVVTPSDIIFANYKLREKVRRTKKAA